MNRPEFFVTRGMQAQQETVPLFSCGQDGNRFEIVGQICWSDDWEFPKSVTHATGASARPSWAGY